MAQAQNSLEERVATLEQVRAISELKYRYWRACDAKDPDGMRDCFVQHGAAIDYGPMGRYDDADGLVAVFTRIALHRLEDGRYAVLDMHHGLHPEITVDSSTRASGRWTLHFRQVDNARGTERVSAGEYEDEYLREDGRWRIAATTYRPSWSLERPLADARVTG